MKMNTFELFLTSWSFPTSTYDKRTISRLPHEIQSVFCIVPIIMGHWLSYEKAVEAKESFDCRSRSACRENHAPTHIMDVPHVTYGVNMNVVMPASERSRGNEVRYSIYIVRYSRMYRTSYH